jgi:multimeric flavodoxin WrbA
MQVLTILGSHRKHGNTAAIIKMIETAIADRAREAGMTLTIDRLNISDVEIKPCRGCRLCFDRGETYCPQKDDLLAVKARFDRADAILCGSPVYVGDMSGSLKTLVDRLAYVCHRPQFYGKSFYLIATSAGSPTTATLNALSGAFLSWGAHLVGRKGFNMGARMPPEEARERFSAPARRIAKKIFKSIHRDEPSRPNFLSLMIFRTQQYTWSRADRDSLDYQYWQNQGWTNPRTTFFMPHRANPFIVFAARLVGGILGRIWS